MSRTASLAVCKYSPVRDLMQREVGAMMEVLRGGRASEGMQVGCSACDVSVLVVVMLGLMTRVIVVMAPVLTAVLVVMHMRGGSVRVLVKMLVNMLMGMRVRVLVSVLLPAMGVSVRVKMRVLMGVQMLVLVFSFHSRSPVHQVFGPFRAHCPGLLRLGSSLSGSRLAILPLCCFPG